MGILKGLGAAAEFYSERLHEKDVAEKKFSQSVELLKMGWENEREIRIENQKIASSAAQTKSTEFLIGEVGKSINTIESSLKGETGLSMDAGLREGQVARLRELEKLRKFLMGSSMGKTGFSKNYILELLYGKEKVNGKDGKGGNISDDVRKAIERLDRSKAGEAVYGGMDEGDEQWDHTKGQVRKQIATTRDDEGKPYRFHRESGERGIVSKAFEAMIATVGLVMPWGGVSVDEGGNLVKDPRISKIYRALLPKETWESLKERLGAKDDAEAGEMLWDNIAKRSEKAGGAVAEKAVEAMKAFTQYVKDVEKDIKNPYPEFPRLFKELIEGITPTESDAVEDVWKGTIYEGKTPSEIDEMITRDGAVSEETPGGGAGDFSQVVGGFVQEEPQGLLSQAAEYPGRHPDRPITDVVDVETIERPPAPVEPNDVNYVEGRKQGQVQLTSMTVGEIAEQFGYDTRVGLGELTYNEIVDLVRKFYYPKMSKKEVRERVDSLPFGYKLQRELLYLSLGEK